MVAPPRVEGYLLESLKYFTYYFLVTENFSQGATSQVSLSLSKRYSKLVMIVLWYFAENTYVHHTCTH